jgi:hypothetical protein
MLAASYAIRYDLAMETDRAIAIAGGEPHYIQDLIDSTDYRAAESYDMPDAIAGNVTNLQDWIANVNSKMGGRAE